MNNHITLKALTERERLGGLFIGLLAYLIIYYSQIGSRIPALGAVRLEFIVGAVVCSLMCFKVAASSESFSENTLNVLCLTFLGVVALGVPFALVRAVALDSFIIFAKSLLIYFMIVAAVDSEKKLRMFLYVYIIMSSLLFVEPFLFSLQGLGFRYNNGMMRLYGVAGFFAHPNSLGAITSSIFPFLYALMHSERSPIRRFLIFLLFPIGLRVIMLTQSRTAFVGVMVFVALLWLHHERKLLSSVMLLVFLSAAFLLAPSQTITRFATLSNMSSMLEFSDPLDTTMVSEYGSMGSRWRLLLRSLHVFMEHPVFGVGIGNYVVESLRVFGAWTPTHNLYTEILAELGIIGFVLFISIIVLTFRNLRTAKKQLFKIEPEESFKQQIIWAVWAFLVMRLVVGFFGHDLLNNYWWVGGGLSVVLLRLAKEGHAALPDSIAKQG